MFEKSAAMFLYAITPVHMGAGTAVGAIDNPIQRERHTEHPSVAGSGLKGALRHAFLAREQARDRVDLVFGPATDADTLHAGALSLVDAQVVLFPVRSLRGAYVYATSPLALSRAARLLALGGVEEAAGWKIPEPSEGRCVVVGEDLVDTAGHVILEAYRFLPDTDGTGHLASIARWIADHAVADDAWMEFFRNKIAKHTVLLPEDSFRHFVRNSTVVEPHVRIHDETGTADDGGLFYTENLPPESLLISAVMVSQTRGTKERRMEAVEVLEFVRTNLGEGPVQIGGDATTGRGQVLVRFV